MSVQNYAERPPWVVSPTDSDNNFHQSPALSPGSWNVASPNSASSYSNSPTERAPPSTPTGGMTTHDFIGLPKNLGEPDHIEKSELDMGREKVAGAKALYLMQQTIGSVPPRERQCTSPPRDGGYSARQEAIQRYKEKKREVKIGASPQAPQRIWPEKKERLATSTRKKTKPTEEEDYENINDFKCQMDLDRERDAKKRALNLLAELGY